MPTSGPYAAVNVAGSNWTPTSGTLTNAVATASDSNTALSADTDWDTFPNPNITQGLTFGIDVAAVEADIPVDATINGVLVKITERQTDATADLIGFTFVDGVKDPSYGYATITSSYIERTSTITSITTRAGATAPTYGVSYGNLETPPGQSWIAEIDKIVFYIEYTDDGGGGGGGGSGPVTGWYQSDVPGIPENVNATVIYTGTPGNPRGIVTSGPFVDAHPLHGSPGHAVVFENRLIYAAANVAPGTTTPTIRVWNGTNDYELCKIPVSLFNQTPSKSVVSMALGDGEIFASTWDYGTLSSDVYGSIYKIDPNSGQMTQVWNPGSFIGHIPYTLLYYNGILWCMTHRSTTAAYGKITQIPILPGTSLGAIRTDLDLTATTIPGIVSAASYDGNFYYGAFQAAGTAAIVGKRTPAGAYSVSDTGGGTAQYNGYYAMAVFNGSLFASYWNPSTISLIRKYDGSSWSTVFTGSGATLKPIVGMFVDNGVLYAIGSATAASVYSGFLLSSVTGTDWTNRTTNLPLTGGDLGDDTLSDMAPTNAFGSISY